MMHKILAPNIYLKGWVMDRTQYEFTVTVPANVAGGFPMPIFDEDRNLIGAFTQHFSNSLRCFVAGTGWTDAIHLDDQFWFTPELNNSGIIVSGTLSAFKKTDESIKVRGAARNYE